MASLAGCKSTVSPPQRVETPDTPDVAVLDLDSGVAFAQMRDVTRWVRDALQDFHIRGFLKTSGASGLHVYIPSPVIPRFVSHGSSASC
jgi:bifunctional non-homologous end joining protein LigD